MYQEGQDYYNAYEDPFWERSKVCRQIKKYCDNKGISAFLASYWKIVASGVMIVVFGLYLICFFQKGVEFEDRFYRTNKEDGIITFEGSMGLDSFEIAVSPLKQDRGQVRYLRNNEEIIYKLNITEQGDLTIYENDQLWFEGTVVNRYQPDGYMILDQNQDFYFEVTFGTGTEMAPVQLRVGQIYGLVTDPEVTRGGAGHPEFLICAIFLTVFWLLDIWFPKMFFYLRHFASVYDPQPSEWYLLMQKISWVAEPIIVLVLLIVSLF